jgi:GcrA cell cycle regulator
MNIHSGIKAASWKALDITGKSHAIIAAYDAAHNTASTIAAKLSQQFGASISRNSVIGVYHRDRPKAVSLLEKFPLKGINMQTVIGRRRQPSPPTVKTGPRKHVLIPPTLAPETIPEMRVTSAPEPLLKTLMEMDRGECRWPVDGDKAMTRFCCHETLDLRSYCEFHHNLSRGRGTPSERAADRVLKRFAA